MEVPLADTALIITGSTGKLGRLLRAAWADAAPTSLRPVWTGRGAGVDVVWDLQSGSVPSLPRDAVVLHLAGVTRGPQAQLDRNPAMVPGLLRGCRQSMARRILFVSTAAVYAPGDRPARESDVPAPANAYGASKLAAERVACDQTDVPLRILRLGNVPGADGLLGPRPNETPIRLDPVPGRDGGPLRSWIGARQLAAVLAQLCRIDLPPVLNLAADPPLDMASLLQASGRAWAYGPPNPAVVPSAVLDTGLLRGLLPIDHADPARLAAEAAWARGVLQ